MALDPFEGWMRPRRYIMDPGWIQFNRMPPGMADFARAGLGYFNSSWNSPPIPVPGQFGSGSSNGQIPTTPGSIPQNPETPGNTGIVPPHLRPGGFNDPMPVNAGMQYANMIPYLNFLRGIGYNNTMPYNMGQNPYMDMFSAERTPRYGGFGPPNQQGGFPSIKPRFTQPGQRDPGTGVMPPANDLGTGNPRYSQPGQRDPGTGVMPNTQGPAGNGIQALISYMQNSFGAMPGMAQNQNYPQLNPTGGSFGNPYNSGNMFGWGMGGRPGMMGGNGSFGGGYNPFGNFGGMGGMGGGNPFGFPSNLPSATASQAEWDAFRANNPHTRWTPEIAAQSEVVRNMAPSGTEYFLLGNSQSNPFGGMFGNPYNSMMGMMGRPGMGGNSYAPYNSLGLPMHNPNAGVEQFLQQMGDWNNQLYNLLGNFGSTGSFGLPAPPMYNYSTAGFQRPATTNVGNNGLSNPGMPSGGAGNNYLAKGQNGGYRNQRIER